MIYLSTVPKKISEPTPPIVIPENIVDPMKEAMEGIVEKDENTPSEETKKTVIALKEELEKKANHLNADALNLLLKKKWDPFSPVVHHSKLKPLACNPVFLCLPSGSASFNSSKRFKNFSLMFGALGKVQFIDFY